VVPISEIAPAPAGYRSAAALMLAAGGINLLIGLVVALGMIFVFPPCCLCGVVPLAWGVVELACGARMMQGTPVVWSRNVAMAGIVVGALGAVAGGVLPLVLEVLASISLRDPEVQAWLDQARPGPLGPPLTGG